MPAPAVRVQEKGQVTIPQEIRKKIGLKKGDLVVFVETEVGVAIQPVELVVSAALDEIGEALQEKGITLEDLLEAGREIRQEIYDEGHARDSDAEENIP